MREEVKLLSAHALKTTEDRKLYIIEINILGQAS